MEVSIFSASSGSASGGEMSVSIFARAGSLLVFFGFGALRTTWSFMVFLTGLAFDDAVAGVGAGGGGFGHDGGYWCAGIGAGADDALADVGGANDIGAVVGRGGRFAETLGALGGGGGGGFGGLGGLAGTSLSGVKVSVSFDAMRPPMFPPFAVPVAVATALIKDLEDFIRFLTLVLLLVDADACSSCECGGSSSLMPADAVAPTASYAPLFIL